MYNRVITIHQYILSHEQIGGCETPFQVDLHSKFPIELENHFQDYELQEILSLLAMAQL